MEGKRFFQTCKRINCTSSSWQLNQKSIFEGVDVPYEDGEFVSVGFDHVAIEDGEIMCELYDWDDDQEEFMGSVRFKLRNLIEQSLSDSLWHYRKSSFYKGQLYGEIEIFGHIEAQPYLDIMIEDGDADTVFTLLAQYYKHGSPSSPCIGIFTSKANLEAVIDLARDPYVVNLSQRLYLWKAFDTAISKAKLPEPHLSRFLSLLLADEGAIFSRFETSRSLAPIPQFKQQTELLNILQRIYAVLKERFNDSKMKEPTSQSIPFDGLKTISDVLDPAIASLNGFNLSKKRHVKGAVQGLLWLNQLSIFCVESDSTSTCSYASVQELLDTKNDLPRIVSTTLQAYPQLAKQIGSHPAPEGITDYTENYLGVLPLRSADEREVKGPSSTYSMEESKTEVPEAPVQWKEPTLDLGSILVADVDTLPGSAPGISGLNGNVAQVAVGSKHAGVVTISGLLYMWGANEEYQLGDGTVNDVSVPTLTSIANVKQIALAHRHSMALKDDGKVYTWGSGMMGILGHVSDIDQETPKVLTTYDTTNEVCVHIACGPNGSGMITIDNATQTTKAYFWGSATTIPSGPDDNTPSLTPRHIPFAVNIVQLSFGNKHACAISEEGTLFAWGNNEFGQLGTGDTSGDYVSTPLLNQKLKKHGAVSMVRCGQRHTSCVIEGRVWSFGSGETHQIGVFDNVDQYEPVSVKELREVVSLSVGDSSSIAVTNSGDAWLWGFSVGTPVPKRQEALREYFVTSAALGDSSLMVLKTGKAQTISSWDFDEDVEMKEVEWFKGKRLRSISVGKEHFAASTLNGKVLVWGCNRDGQLGTGNDIDMPFPVAPTMPAPISCIKASYTHTIALTNDGRVVTWGSGQMGKLGHGTDADNYVPTIVETKHVAVSIAAGQHNSGCITDKGELLVWGMGVNGQIGPDHGTVFSPKILDVNKEKFQSLSFGNKHGIACTVDGKVYTWGCNQFGQLGYDSDGDIVAQVPKECEWLKNQKIKQVLAVENTSMFLNESGDVWSCGSGETFLTGNGSDYDQPIPTVIEGLKDAKVAELSGGGMNCCALTVDGRVFAWGWGAGQTPQLISPPPPPSSSSSEQPITLVGCMDTIYLVQ